MSRFADSWKRVRRRMLVLAGPPLIAGVLWGWSKTLRFVSVYSPELEAAWREQEGVLYLVWHGRMLMTLPYFRRYHPRAIAALISTHRDGEFITRIARRFHIDSVRGSARRGGGKAMSEMVEALARGRDIAITPDGPRGPAMEIKRGIIDLARRTSAPICPVGIAAWPARSASSWDAFQLPLPGARMAFVFGAPIKVPPDVSPSERAAFRELAERRMAEAMDHATRLARGYPGPVCGSPQTPDATSDAALDDTSDGKSGAASAVSDS